MNPRPADYESAALPLSYAGPKRIIPYSSEIVNTKDKGQISGGARGAESMVKLRGEIVLKSSLKDDRI